MTVLDARPKDKKKNIKEEKIKVLAQEELQPEPRSLLDEVERGEAIALRRENFILRGEIASLQVQSEQKDLRILALQAILKRRIKAKYMEPDPSNSTGGQKTPSYLSDGEEEPQGEDLDIDNDVDPPCPQSAPAASVEDEHLDIEMVSP